jgi:hypothetical protein
MLEALSKFQQTAKFQIWASVSSENVDTEILSQIHIMYSSL